MADTNGVENSGTAVVGEMESFAGVKVNPPPRGSVLEDAGYETPDPPAGSGNRYGATQAAFDERFRRQARGRRACHLTPFRRWNHRLDM